LGKRGVAHHTLMVASIDPSNQQTFPLDITELEQLIDRQRIVDDLVEMIRCESVNPFDARPTPGNREAEFAELYLNKMKEVGLEVGSHEVVPGRANVWGRLLANGPQAGTGRSVMLAGHLDTVGVDGYDKPFSAHINNERVFGRGSCDMKAALAAYLEVVRVLRCGKVELTGDVLVAGICDEEHKMTGSAEFAHSGPAADVAIIGEPTELAVCPAHKGQICLVITTYGTAVHSSRPELGVNAIVAMSHVITALGTYADDLRHGQSHALCGLATTNPGVITGGTIASTVPDICHLEIDRRTLPGQSVELVMEELRNLLEPLRAKGLRFDISEPTLLAHPLDTPLDHPLVNVVTTAASSVRKRAIMPTAFPAATDAPNLGIPSVICGPGSLSDAHTLHESVAIDDVVAAAKIYLRSILLLQSPVV
jgi:acetylornithine deacetylase/succinyl-diaminopimelate desuccinylase family protein